MKRDMDLVRTILLQIEELGEHPNRGIELDIPGHSSEEIAHHVLLMRDAGLVEALDLSTRGGFAMKPKRLTWEGHEFLAAAKNENLWNRAKDLAVEKGGPIPFEILKSLLLKWAATYFGLS